MFETREDLQEKVYLSLGESGTLLKGDDYFDEEHEVGLAIDVVIRELGVSFPLTNATLCYWAVERGKRHSFDIIRASSARKFRYKQIHLNQRFAHYDILIDKMDEQFAYALESNAELAGIKGLLFIHYIKPGFVYDEYGRDISHEIEV